MRATAPLTTAEARTLIARIRLTTGTLRSLLPKAYGRKAWGALGYNSWRAHEAEKFPMSRQHGYRSLDQGWVIRTEAAARDLEPVLPAVTEEIREQSRSQRRRSPRWWR